MLFDVYDVLAKCRIKDYYKYRQIVQLDYSFRATRFSGQACLEQERSKLCSIR